jgi:hypothetical protein
MGRKSADDGDSIFGIGVIIANLKQSGYMQVARLLLKTWVAAAANIVENSRNTHAGISSMPGEEFLVRQSSRSTSHSVSAKPAEVC